jgi:DNA-binding MarR family transcriptional regulator
MGLEKDINQHNFRNERQKAIINMIYTYNWLIEDIRNKLEQFGLTLQQFNILRILRGARGPISTLQIRERMLDKMSDTSRIVDRLVLKNLVQKTPCHHDKRLVDVVISRKGLNLLSELDSHIDDFDNAIGNLSFEESRQLNELLDKVRSKPGVAELVEY